MTLRFEDWLAAQQPREDHIGELARKISTEDIEHKLSRRKPDEHKSWADIVISIAEPGHIIIFNDAWQEFLLAKQAAMDVVD